MVIFLPSQSMCFFLVQHRDRLFFYGFFQVKDQCLAMIAIATKFWANLKPEEETIISFFVNEKKFALIEEQLWINNIFSKIFDWIV